MFPIIVGCERSGTTMLRAMIDSHPLVAVPPESHFLADLANCVREHGQDLDHEWFMATLVQHERFQKWELPASRVRASLRQVSPSTVAEAVHLLYREYARSRGKQRYGDKTPRYVREIGTLAEMLPDSVFIHLIRDGRDVALSYLDVGFGPGSVAEAARVWREDVLTGRRAGQQLRKGRYVEVRYEELVNSPQRELARICDAIGICFDPAMLRYSERAEEIVRRTFAPRAHANLLRPPTAGLRDWRREMPASQLKHFQEIAGEALQAFGYATSGALRVERGQTCGTV